MVKLETANGYPMGECVSALQKCIRRGIEEEALFWAAELESRYPDYLWVRLTVIANEDIGLAQPEVLTLVEALRQQYQFLRHAAKGPAERLPLTNAILAMCRARKTRLADDLLYVVWGRREFEPWRPEIPDCALDKHTGRGRRMGRGNAHWQTEGCKLFNEAEGLNVYADRAATLRGTYGPLPRSKPGRTAAKTTAPKGRAAHGQGQFALDIE